ncbi:MFS transporter [Nocardioides halotolerans]|jgi:MFS family permease|uniref:MFS transporter n=1 Tax=Nocardioides halotolerans TaxID=433660 RepID=UPI000414898E|nr:MFS transporter [Nocardioides halotolerans]
MLGSYRSVLSRPGALRFSAAGLVGRLPLSMAGLGMLLLVQADTGSYGVGGSVAAVYMVANAVAAIPLGRLVDALGQGRVLATTSVVFGLGLVGLAVAVHTGWPSWSWYAAAAVAGASLPPIDACVRTRWAHVLEGPDSASEVETAYAFEAVVDESVFMVGPILVTLLGTLVDPAAGIVATVVAGVGGSLAFAAQRGTEPPAHPRDRSAGPQEPLPWRTLAPVTVVCVALGLMFGGTEVITVAFADEQGTKSAAGLLLALWALGSLTAGAVTGALRFRRSLAQRVRWGALGLVLAMAPLFLVDSIGVMGALMLVGGLAIAPTLIATTAMIEQVTPPARLTEGMALLQTGLVAGVAPGAALAGVVVDAGGSSPAYLAVSLGAAVLAAAAARALPSGSAERADMELGASRTEP